MTNTSDESSERARLGEILLRRGVISPVELEDALRVQEADPDRPLGEILVTQQAATPSQVREALREQLANVRLGQILLRFGAISVDDLAIALDIQATSGGLLGEILVKTSACTAEQVNWALSQQNREKRFCSHLLRRRLITPEQLDLALQRLTSDPDISIEKIMVECGFLTDEQACEALTFQSQEVKLGQILLQNASLTPSQLERALDQQTVTGQILGEILVASGTCTLEQIGRALQMQLGPEPATPQLDAGALAPEA